MAILKLTAAHWVEAVTSAAFSAGALGILVAIGSPYIGREVHVSDIDLIALVLFPICLCGWVLEMRRREKKQTSSGG
ncbi:hypothetical protein [Lysobacter sp. HA35]